MKSPAGISRRDGAIGVEKERTTVMIRIETVLACFVAAACSTGCASMMGIKSDRQMAEDMRKAMDHERPIPDFAKHPVRVAGAQEILEAGARSSLSGMSPPPTFLKAYPIEQDWEMVRAPSGVITGRELRVEVFYKGGQTGFCRWEDTTMHQDEQGGGQYGSPRFIGFGSNPLGHAGFRVSCNEVATLPSP